MARISSRDLLCNDPAMAAQVIEAALNGDMDAQFIAGLVYAEGRGVPPDLVQAWFWLTRAVEQGDGDADRLRRIVGSRMNDEEFARARHLLAVSRGPSPNRGPPRPEMH